MKKDVTSCSVCGVKYVKSKDTKKYGRWVGCENCSNWTHRKCLKWTESDVDEKEYMCTDCV